MRKSKFDKALFIAVPTLLLILFCANMATSDELSTATAIASVGTLFGFVSYLRSREFSKKYPIDALIEKDGDTLVFHYLHGVQKKPLQVNIDAIYALNFSHHYLGVIVDNNGQGFDFQYPHKTSVVKARLHELLGEDTFAKIQSNVAAMA